MYVNEKCERYDGSPLERGCAEMCGGGGVFARILDNTPLHPSQEGNRTTPNFHSASFSIFQSLNMLK
jgi:hypothetical protein